MSKGDPSAFSIPISTVWDGEGAGPGCELSEAEFGPDTCGSGSHCRFHGSKRPSEHRAWEEVPMRAVTNG